MADHTDKSSQDPQLGRTTESRSSDRKADRVQPEAHDDEDADAEAQRSTQSRPRGKTEDPDRTL